jgi:preprotein translocase subunit SecA
MLKFLRTLFGSRNERLIKRYGKTVDRINALEPEFQALSDADLRARTALYRQRYTDGETLDSLLPEAFAAVREASSRTLGLRHFDAQLIGGMVLNDNKIAEMRTGEGKTLVATLPVYLNALTGGGAHVVTVNEYLAARDAEWMGPVYRFLGMDVGVIRAGMDPAAKREAYGCAVTYGTNNEFGFDYLRDNLAHRLEDKAQRALTFAIVDEVDSILIDEARTPLIISGPSEDNTDTYLRIDKLVPQLTKQEEEDGPGDFSVDEKSKQAYLTEDGHQKVEELLVESGLLEAGQSLYDAQNIALMHHITAALRAHSIYTKDVEYLVQDGQVVIVDEFTGRTMPGRRWSEGLHQAIEAKEGVSVQQENQTLASITFQNYFRMYGKLAGMTGTADTEAFEFQQIYGLEVVVIPTHRPMVRVDNSDMIYLNSRGKFRAIIDDIEDCRERKQPVLVGTTSIEVSELLSDKLKKSKIPHKVLNAKQHEMEAEIIAQAGRPGSVTIATNMAGRGTDIVLGGNLEAELKALPEGAGEVEITKVREAWEARHQQVLESGGLHIIGTERHESRRIDNQLRGRSGRQGDAGSSRFYLSFEDNLMRIFASDTTRNLIERLGLTEDEVIESKMVSKRIEAAQRKVEAYNFDIRKQLLEYDDVSNDQRKVIYGQRDQLLGDVDISETITDIRHYVIDLTVEEHMPRGSVEEQWDVAGLEQVLAREFETPLAIQQILDDEPTLDPDGVRQRILDAVDATYEAKVSAVGESVMRHLEHAVMLQQLDTAWKEHLAAMDYLRQGIHLRGYAQKNPKQEYKREAFEMFQDMLERVRRDVIRLMMKVRLRTEGDVEDMERQRRERQAGQSLEAKHAAMMGGFTGVQPVPAGAQEDALGTHRPRSLVPTDPASGVKVPETFKRTERKVGRNEPCSCGSGKKYKQCHGKLA